MGCDELCCHIPVPFSKSPPTSTGSADSGAVASSVCEIPASASLASKSSGSAALAVLDFFFFFPSAEGSNSPSGVPLVASVASPSLGFFDFFFFDSPLNKSLSSSTSLSAGVGA